jgi:Mn2+/Fe2+ NRAMP family transporter
MLAGVLCVVLQIFVQYTSYVSVLKWLTLSLFAYFGTVMVVHIPWEEMVRGLFIPTLSATTTFWTSVVAILGTTISPYLFFWQASQEVEEVEAAPTRDTAHRAVRGDLAAVRGQAPRAGGGTRCREDGLPLQ